MIERTPFYIHNARLSEYDDPDGKHVQLIVCDITVNDAARSGPRAVIILGATEDRMPLLDAFTGENPEPVGPVITYAVPLKGGQKFWRLEVAPDENDQGQLFEAGASKRTR
jgi:hypothetical protein